MAQALTLQEIARLAGGDIVRTGDCGEIRGIAALDVAGPQEASFLGNERYRPLFRSTAAGVVLVKTGETGGPEATALVAVENPSLAFAALVTHFATAASRFEPGVHPRATVADSAALDPARCKIHPGAVVMDGARIGDGTEIGPNAVIGEHAAIGENCRIMANVTIRERCVLGNRVILQPGVVIGSDGYGYEMVDGRHSKIDQFGIVEIGDDVEIGANSTVDRARFGKTIIGEGTKIDNLVQIGHNCVIGRHCLIVALTGLAGSVKLGDYVICGGQVGIVGHVEIGSRSILTARTGVTSSLPGGETYSGRPAMPMREDYKIRATVRRLPKLVDRVKALEKAARNEEAGT